MTWQAGFLTLAQAPEFNLSLDDVAPEEALIVLAIVGGMFLYLAVTVFTIASRLRVSNRWMAFIPILNIFLMCSIGRRSMMWGVAMFIPILNVIAWSVIWGGIAEATGRSSAWGCLMLIPPINLLIPLFLALGAPQRAVAPERVRTYGAVGGYPIATMHRCPACGAAADAAQQFCTNCGTSLKAPAVPLPRRCPNAQCGNVVVAGELFCRMSGMRCG